MDFLTTIQQQRAANENSGASRKRRPSVIEFTRHGTEAHCVALSSKLDIGIERVKVKIQNRNLQGLICFFIMKQLDT